MVSENDSILIWTTSSRGRPETFGKYHQKSYEILAALNSLHEKFSDLVAISSCGEVSMRLNSVQLKKVMMDLCLLQDHLGDYLNLSPEGDLTDETLSRLGFSVSYHLADSADGSILTKENGGIGLSLQGRSASAEPTSQSILNLPLRFERYFEHSLKDVFRILVEKWESHIGGVTVPSYEQAIRGADRASYAGQWLYYLPFPQLGNCLPADIKHEPFVNGILIETTPHMPDANNPADIAAGKRVRDVLDELGLINHATYAIEGWPPDKEETLYEQFISGAPANRKYTVHCVNFDGYDPDRKVLLYAKLFRQLKQHPKAHGLRGWDGPVLNEAKRQVNAAAKAGKIPIEWHIGLEEPAKQVKQLLADYTNITDQQLQVIYTPMEQMFSND